VRQRGGLALKLGRRPGAEQTIATRPAAVNIGYRQNKIQSTLILGTERFSIFVIFNDLAASS